MSICNPTKHIKELENPPKWTEEEKNVIAWSIDWEGSICLKKGTDKRNSSGFNIQPIICLGNTNLPLLQKFFDIVKIGKIYQSRKQNLKHKACFMWIIRNFDDVEYFLSNIHPYLCAKKQQSSIILEFLKSRKERGIENKQQLPYSQFEIDCINRTRKYNKKGPRINE